jgi:hypothetical protein
MPENKNIKKYTGMRALSQTLNSVTNPIFRKRGFVENKIITDWSLIVGENLGNYSAPRKLFFGKDKKTDGVLHVDVFDSGMAMELSYMEQVVLEKIASYFGYRAINKIKIIQKLGGGIAAKKQPPERKLSEDKMMDLGGQLDDIDDEDLKKALQAFGVSVMSKVD